MSMKDDVDRLAGKRGASALSWVLALVIAILGAKTCMSDARCSPPGFLDEPASGEERRVVEKALDKCSRGRAGTDPFLVLTLSRLEAQLGVPRRLRGILLAVWCVEGGLRLAHADGTPLRGDFVRGVPLAHGPFQLHAWAEGAACSLTRGGRDDLLASARCWWTRMVVRHDEARAEGCDEPWRVAEARVSNRNGYLRLGCRAESSHWREWVSWSLTSGDGVGSTLDVPLR